MNNIQLIAELTIGSPEKFTLAALRRYQLARINETLEYCKTASRFYRQYLPDSDLTLSRLEDLNRIPMTAQAHLREAGIEGFLCAKPGDIGRIVTQHTSGSTGHPKRVGFTAEEMEQTIAFFYYGMRDLTGPNQKVMICMPGNKENGVSDLLSKAITRLGAIPLFYGNIQDTGHAARWILDHGPSCIAGIPAQILRLAVFAEKHGLSGQMRIDCILLSADYLANSIRDRIESVFHCTVYNHYGSTEMGYGAALECAAHEGMHLREAELFFEVVDPATGRHMPAGQEGELVFTTLKRTGMPLIRYRTGDVAHYMRDACPCGSLLPRISAPRRKDGCQIPGRPVTLHSLDETLFLLDELTDYAVAAKIEPDGGVSLDFTLWTLDGQGVNQGQWDQVQERVMAMMPADQRTDIRWRPAEPSLPPPGLRGKRLISS
jgi:phenylacetate-coenzyme A ligase PaaK-like adenylate-forming protein